MIGKSVIVLVVALVATQAYASYLKNSKTEEVLEINVEDIWDEAKELLEKLKNIIKTAVDDAVNQINTLLKEIEDLANKIISDTTNSINKAIEELLDELEILKQKAIDAGVDIAECTAENEDALKNLPKELILNAITCITNKVDEAKKILTDTITDVTDTYKKVEDLAQEIDDCGTGLSAVLCVTKVVGKITLAITELPVEIANQISKATKYVATLKIDLAACAAVQVTKATVDGGKILAIIAKCIDDKMHELQQCNPQ